MATYRDKGIVLRIKGLRDNDRQYIVFTKDHGKIILLAKGLRKTRSKMSPHMATFGVVELMVARGKIWDRLAGASLIIPYRAINDSLERSVAVQSFLLAVDSLTKKEYPEPKIFDLVNEYILAVSAVELDGVGARTLAFDSAILKLLDILGFGLELEVCVSCRQKLSYNDNAFNVIKGGIECEKCHGVSVAKISGDTIKVLRFLRNANIKSSYLLRLNYEVLREVSFLTEILLTSHLEARFDPLRFMSSIRQ